MLSYSVIAYIIYLWIGVGLTFWVAHILFKNARVFFSDIFNHNEELALSVNHLLKAGFYLVNLGLVLYLLENPYTVSSYKELFEVVSVKVGGVVLLLGAMHLFNVYILFKLRSKATSTPHQLALNNGEEHPYFGKSMEEELAAIKNGKINS